MTSSAQRRRKVLEPVQHGPVLTAHQLKPTALQWQPAHTEPTCGEHQIPLHWNNGLILWGKLDPSAPTLRSGLILNSSLEWEQNHGGFVRAREQIKAFEINHVVP